MGEKYEFSKGYYFPLNFRLAGYFGLMTGLLLCVTPLFYVGIPVLLISCIASFLRHKMRLNTRNKTIKSYNDLFGLEFGRPIPYAELKGIGIKDGVKTQNMALRANSMTLRKKIFYGRLYFDRKSVLLESSEERKTLELKMKRLSKQLNLPVLI